MRITGGVFNRRMPTKYFYIKQKMKTPPGPEKHKRGNSNGICIIQLKSRASYAKNLF